MAWRTCCKAPSLLVDEQPHEQPLEAQQFIKGAPGKRVVSHEWTCRWCTWRVVATGINKLRNHLLGTSTQVRACTASSQVFLAVRDELLGVQQQQLAAAATAANVRAAAAAAAVGAAGPTPAGRPQGGLLQTSMHTGLQGGGGRQGGGLLLCQWHRILCQPQPGVRSERWWLP